MSTAKSKLIRCFQSATKLNNQMATKLNKIANLSRQDKQLKFDKLISHFGESNLTCCFNELDGRKAVGVDGKTKADYAWHLDANIRQLVKQMKSFSYKPQPVREVLIPKSNGQTRPLGISNIEDKIVQLMFSKILEAIYEPIFCKFSYGFRRGKSAHGAIRDAVDYLRFNGVKVVLDIDLENFFGTINHKALMKMLHHRIADKCFLRYVSRMLKAGKQTEGGKVTSDVGLPQGSIMSPVLANIYAHYVIDLWFLKVVPAHTIGNINIFRYCDDFIVCCSDTRDVTKLVRSLGKRLEKFNLKLNKDKTKAVNFSRYAFDLRGVKQDSFDFLGFTFYISKACKGGFTTIKVKTSKKTLRAKLANVKEWLRKHRFRGGIRDLWLTFCKKLRGHIVYFGVTNNSQPIQKFLQQARRLFFKWLNRRSQKQSFNWKQFAAFEREYPMPQVKIYHQIYEKQCNTGWQMY